MAHQGLQCPMRHEGVLISEVAEAEFETID
jgi:hypothetical protein